MGDTTITTIAYYNEAADTYKNMWNDVSVMAAQRAKFIRLVPQPAYVLDLGCGTGRDLYELDAAGYDMVGYDLSPGMLEVAAGLFDGPLICGDMRDMPFQPGGFDAVWAAASLLHLPAADVAPTLASIATILRSEGIAYLTVKTGEGEAVDGHGRFYSYWTPTQFDDLVEAAGFEIIESYLSETGPVEWTNVFAAKRA